MQPIWKSQTHLSAQCSSMKQNLRCNGGKTILSHGELVISSFCTLMHLDQNSEIMKSDGHHGNTFTFIKVHSDLRCFLYIVPHKEFTYILVERFQTVYT